MDILKDLKKNILNYNEIEFAIVFGSILDKNRFNKNSDIDIAIAGNNIFDYDFILDLNLSLSASFNYEFDIVDLNKNSGVILQQALCNGKILLNKNNELYVQLIKKMWYNQADMMQNVRMIWKKRREKLL